MNRQEIEAALEADWESVVSFFHNLFHKASNPEVPASPAPESPPVEVAPPQVVVDPVVVAPPVEAPAVVAPDTSNPFVAYKAQGIGLYDLMAPGKLGRYLTAEELAQAKAAGYDTSTLEPAATLTPDGFDPHKTNLDPSDFGKVFKAEPGTTTYTVNVPNGARAFLLRDGEMEADEMATFSLDDGPSEKCIFSGPIADLTPGSHKVTVACNYEMSFQIQP